MSKITAIVVASVKELWSLIVDDGFLAIAALAAIGIAYGLSRDNTLGPTNLVGWALVTMIVVATVASVRRAVAAHVRRQ
jgi:hypothetical protein